MRPLVPSFAAALLLAMAGAAVAQTDACAAFKWSVAREQQAFAAETLGVATGASYPQPGTAVSVTLAGQDAVGYTVKPRRAPKSSPAYGAELTGSVPQGGRYQVTLSEDAWVDLAQGGKTLRSTAFSGKEGCPGVRKSVRFDLAAGPVTIAISDAPVGTVKLDLLPSD